MLKFLPDREHGLCQYQTFSLPVETDSVNIIHIIGSYLCLYLLGPMGHMMNELTIRKLFVCACHMHGLATYGHGMALI